MDANHEEQIRDLAARLEAARSVYTANMMMNTPVKEPERTIAAQEYAVAKAKMFEAQRALAQAIGG